MKELLSCQPRVKVTSCFVYKVIRDLYSIDHLCINPIRRIGLKYTSDLSIRVSSSKVYKLKFYLTIVNIILRYYPSGWYDSRRIYSKFMYTIYQSKEEGKDQESIQSSALPDRPRPS